MAGNGQCLPGTGKEIDSYLPTFPVGIFFGPLERIRKVIKKILLLFVFISLISPESASAAGRITVAAASDLSYALKEIAASFERETGVKVALSFGSTGMLSRQIEEGAPFDVFFSADIKRMEGLKKLGLIIPQTSRVYAQGLIVVAVRDKRGIKVKTLEDLLSPEVKRVSIANPEHAPYGAAAREALEASGLWERLKDRLVYGENVRQALQFVETGDAQAGIVALSIARVKGISTADISPELYNPIYQSAAVLKKTSNEKAARRFLDYAAGPKGRAALSKYGFNTPR